MRIASQPEAAPLPANDRPLPAPPRFGYFPERTSPGSDIALLRSGHSRKRTHCKCEGIILAQILFFFSTFRNVTSLLTRFDVLR